MRTSIFVYGTLKRGYHNHYLLEGAIAVEPATIWGRLYGHHPRIPVVVVPGDSVLLKGSRDVRSDARALKELRLHSVPPWRPSKGDWGLVHGELVTIADALQELPPVDRLEGFGGRMGMGLYDRVAVATTVDGGGGGGGRIEPAWVYRASRLYSMSDRVADGRWGDSLTSSLMTPAMIEAVSEEGYEAGLCRIHIDACPYAAEGLRTAWLKGRRDGLRDSFDALCVSV